MLREIGESKLGNMVNAEELVVSFRAEGADDTVESMEQVEGQLEDTTDQMEDQAEAAEGFTTKFRGAMGALVAGIAVAAGGLLSKVPVLGETFSGFMAIVDKLALSLDETLRPAFSDLRDELFDISDEIDADEDITANMGTVTLEFSKLAFGSFSDLLTGKGDIADISMIIGGSLTAKWLMKRLPSIGLGKILTKIPGAGLLRLIPVISIGAFLGGLAGGELGELLGNEDLGELLGALTGATLAGLLGKVGIGTILSKLSLASLSSLLGSISASAVIAPVASVALLIGGTASLGDLIDGDISGWNLPAKLGKALGEAFDRAWPDIADTIETGFTENPIHDAGANTRAMWEGNWEWTGLATGGIVTGPTPAMVGEGSESEAVLPLSQLDSMLQSAKESGSGGAARVNLDGRRLNESTGRYGYDQLTRRGI